MLIIKLSAFGDVVHTLPLVTAVKRAAPEISIDWAVSDDFTGLVRMSRDIDEIFPFKRRQWGRWWRPSALGEMTDFIKRIREREYGAVLDLQGLLRSGVITCLSRSSFKVGFAYAREGARFCYTDKIGPIGDNAHAVDRYLSALAGLGVEFDGKIEYGLTVPDREKLWADTVAPQKPFVIINPNTRWVTKRWPAERFGQLARELYEREGLMSVVTGAPGDAERGRAVAEVAGGAAVDLTGKGGLSHLAALIEKSAGMITNDSGPLHLAVALGVPTVSIFGPTSPERTGPYGPGHAVVRHDLDCAPCFRRTCPYNHECLERVTVAETLEAWRGVSKLISKG